MGLGLSFLLLAVITGSFLSCAIARCLTGAWPACLWEPWKVPAALGWAFRGWEQRFFIWRKCFNPVAFKVAQSEQSAWDGVQDRSFPAEKQVRHNSPLGALHIRSR